MRNNEIDKPTGRRTGGKNLMRSPEEKEALIKEWEASGLGTRPFLESKGIPRTPFMRWLRSYEKDGLDGLKKRFWSERQG